MAIWLQARILRPGQNWVDADFVLAQPRQTRLQSRQLADLGACGLHPGRDLGVRSTQLGGNAVPARRLRSLRRLEPVLLHDGFPLAHPGFKPRMHCSQWMEFKDVRLPAVVPNKRRCAHVEWKGHHTRTPHSQADEDVQLSMKEKECNWNPMQAGAFIASKRFTTQFSVFSRIY